MKKELFYDDEGNLIKERIKEKTPSGGDYSELCYLEDGKVVIRECKSNGTIISETWGMQ